jgi:hypothetical protein
VALCAAGAVLLLATATVLSLLTVAAASAEAEDAARAPVYRKRLNTVAADSVGVGGRTHASKRKNHI